MSSEDLLNVIGITASISLGLLLIGLSAFVIWLRKRFVDERLSVSLDAIRDLVRKQLTDTEHQIREVIGDAIRTVPAPPDLQGLAQAVTAIRDDLKRLEHQIREVIGDAIRTVPAPPDLQGLEEAVMALRDDLKHLTDADALRTVPAPPDVDVMWTGLGSPDLQGLAEAVTAMRDDLKRLTDADALRTVSAQLDLQGLAETVTVIRDDLKRLTDAAAVRVAVPVELPEKIAMTFDKWRDFPAHFLVLRAILREGAVSLDMLRTVAERYGIPEPFDSGVENLLQKGVLEGTLSDFRVPSDIRHPLLAWMTTNEPVLLEVAAHFSSVPSKDKADGEVQKALQGVRSALGRRLRI